MNAQIRSDFICNETGKLLRVGEKILVNYANQEKIMIVTGIHPFLSYCSNVLKKHKPILHTHVIYDFILNE